MVKMLCDKITGISKLRTELENIPSYKLQNIHAQ